VRTNLFFFLFFLGDHCCVNHCCVLRPHSDFSYTVFSCGVGVNSD
jgi:hypothetical protein